MKKWPVSCSRWQRVYGRDGSPCCLGDMQPGEAFRRNKIIQDKETIGMKALRALGRAWHAPRRQGWWVGPRERMSDRSQWEAEWAKEGSWSETTEGQAEMIRWEEWGAPWRQLHSEVANPCFLQLRSKAGANTTKKTEPKKPHFNHRIGLKLFLLSDPQYPCACWAGDHISSPFVWLLILGFLTYCHSHCCDS